MNSLLNTFGIMGILAAIGWVVAGFFIITGIFGKNYQDRRRETDQLADGLIKRLQQTVDQQTQDIASMRVELTSQRAEMNHIKGRNAVLEELFKGRDPGMQEFLKDAPSLMEIARANNSLAKENSQEMAKLTSTLSRFFERLEPARAATT